MLHEPKAKPSSFANKAVVVGAGFSGIHATYGLKRMGFDVTTIEAGSDVGGTWYWNRYPGARVDSENYYYSYTFPEAKDLYEEWRWSHRYCFQPELQNYLSFAADKLGIRENITFGTRVLGADWHEDGRYWTVTLDDGTKIDAQFVLLAVGCLSKPVLPDIPGLADFKGELYQTAAWPHDAVDFDGMRVGVVGTGASGAQTIGAVAPLAKELIVFQRTPNWVLPIRNGPLSNETRAAYQESRAEFHDKCLVTPGGFPFAPPANSASDLTPEARKELLESTWERGGINYIQTFADAPGNRETNEIMKDMPRAFITAQVRDPETARRLTPTHPIFTKRPIMCDIYLDTYNRDNVRLIDITETPITGFYDSGVELGDQRQELDMLILATGFDAMTGSILDIDISGIDGLKMRDYWKNGARNYLGLAAPGFPNMFQVVGPFSPSILANVPIAAEQHVEWITDCIRFMQDNGLSRIEADPDAQELWLAEVKSIADALLYKEVSSWYNGDNVPGKPQGFPIWAGGLDAYKIRCDQVAEKDYQGFVLS